MQTRSAAFDLAVTQGAPVVVTATAARSGLTPVPLTLDRGASIAVDASASVRRTLRATVVDVNDTLAPRTSADILTPYFNSEVSIATGFRLPDGTTETLPMGVFRLEEPEADGRGKIAISGSDRSVIVASARFETPYVIASGTSLLTVAADGTVGGAIRDLINSRYPGLTYLAPDGGSTVTLPLTVFEEGDRSGDPWSNARQLASSAGLEVFFDVLGRVVIRKVPDVTLAALAWTYQPGANSIILDSLSRFSSKGVRNVAVVIGEGPNINPPIRSSAEVTDATSPIFPGTFGRRAAFLVSPLITSQAQADAASASFLKSLTGGSELLAFTAVPHPAHDGGDIVRVVNADLPLDVLAVLDRFTMPVDLGSAVSYQTKGRRAA